jgi:hypothetical protein
LTINIDPEFCTAHDECFSMIMILGASTLQISRRTRIVTAICPTVFVTTSILSGITNPLLFSSIVVSFRD